MKKISKISLASVAALTFAAPLAGAATANFPESMVEIYNAFQYSSDIYQNGFYYPLSAQPGAVKSGSFSAEEFCKCDTYEEFGVVSSINNYRFNETTATATIESSTTLLPKAPKSKVSALSFADYYIRSEGAGRIELNGFVSHDFIVKSNSELFEPSSILYFDGLLNIHGDSGERVIEDKSYHLTRPLSSTGESSFVKSDFFRFTLSANLPNSASIELRTRLLIDQFTEILGEDPFASETTITSNLTYGVTSIRKSEGVDLYFDSPNAFRAVDISSIAAVPLPGAFPLYSSIIVLAATWGSRKRRSKKVAG